MRLGVFFFDFDGVVGGAVVDEEDFVFGIFGEFEGDEDGIEAAGEVGGGVFDGDDDGDFHVFIIAYGMKKAVRGTAGARFLMRLRACFVVCRDFVAFPAL